MEFMAELELAESQSSALICVCLHKLVIFDFKSNKSCPGESTKGRPLSLKHVEWKIELLCPS